MENVHKTNCKSKFLNLKARHKDMFHYKKNTNIDLMVVSEVSIILMSLETSI